MDFLNGNQFEALNATFEGASAMADFLAPALIFVGIPLTFFILKKLVDFIKSQNIEEKQKDVENVATIQTLKNDWIGIIKQKNVENEDEKIQIKYNTGEIIDMAVNEVRLKNDIKNIELNLKEKPETFSKYEYDRLSDKKEELKELLIEKKALIDNQEGYEKDRLKAIFQKYEKLEKKTL